MELIDASHTKRTQRQFQKQEPKILWQKMVSRFVVKDFLHVAQMWIS